MRQFRVFAESTNKALSDIRSQILHNKLMRERSKSTTFDQPSVALCMAPMICHMRDDDLIFDLQSGRCQKPGLMLTIRRAAFTAISKVMGFGPPPVEPLLDDYCGASTPFTRAIRMMMAFRGMDLPR